MVACAYDMADLSHLDLSVESQQLFRVQAAGCGAVGVRAEARAFDLQDRLRIAGRKVLGKVTQEMKKRRWGGAAASAHHGTTTHDACALLPDIFIQTAHGIIRRCETINLLDNR